MVTVTLYLTPIHSHVKIMKRLALSGNSMIFCSTFAPCFAARANYLFLALDRKAELADRSGHPIPSGNSGLNLTDQGYRSWPIKVTAHIHWKDSKQERSMEVEFHEVCLCSE